MPGSFMAASRRMPLWEAELLSADLQGLLWIRVVLICRAPRASLRMRSLNESWERSVNSENGPSTLVIYVFSKTDPEYERNLQFFVQHGMWEGDGCEYVIIVQQVGCLITEAAPSMSADYIQRRSSIPTCRPLFKQFQGVATMAMTCVGVKRCSRLPCSFNAPMSGWTC